jgi:hypothetical protein
MNEGPKPLLRPSHICCIRTKLQIAGRTSDLALFNLARIASCAAAMWGSR